MNTDKIKITLLCSLVLSVILSVSAFAAEGLIYFSDPTVEAGNNVEVQMTVQCDTEKVGEVNVLLKYPSEELVFIDGTSASGGAGTIRVHGSGVNTENGKYVYSLNFATKKQGEYTVSIDSDEVYSEAGELITVSHRGTSKITVTASTTINKDVMLSSLEIRPGTLIPSFDPAISNYNTTVGLSVDRLTITANPADSSCKVEAVNHEDLKEGENDIIIYVTSEDGTKQSEYHIIVLKTEGGEENVPSESETEQNKEVSTGVQLSCKGKTITIMDPTSTTNVPEGFRESKIKIDGQPVTGWITGDSENPEYFLVYGMNDEGEINFYRYDRKEKTIQRYFNETKVTDITKTEEYIALNTQYEDAKKDLETRKMFIYIISTVVLLLIGILIYLAIRLSSVSRELEFLQDKADRKKANERSLDPDKSKRSRRTVRTDNTVDSTVVIRNSTTEIFSNNNELQESKGFENSDETTKIAARDEINSEDETDDTKILETRQRRRSSRRANNVSDETTVIRRESRRHRTDYDI